MGVNLKKVNIHLEFVTERWSRNDQKVARVLQKKQVFDKLETENENLITASGIEQENPRPDQAGVGVLVSPAGCANNMSTKAGHSILAKY